MQFSKQYSYQTHTHKSKLNPVTTVYERVGRGEKELSDSNSYEFSITKKDTILSFTMCKQLRE